MPTAATDSTNQDGVSAMTDTSMLQYNQGTLTSQRYNDLSCLKAEERLHALSGTPAMRSLWNSDAMAELAPQQDSKPSYGTRKSAPAAQVGEYTSALRPLPPALAR